MKALQGRAPSVTGEGTAPPFLLATGNLFPQLSIQAQKVLPTERKEVPVRPSSLCIFSLSEQWFW